MQVLTPGTPFSTHIHFWMLLPVRKKNKKKQNMFTSPELELESFDCVHISFVPFVLVCFCFLNLLTFNLGKKSFCRSVREKRLSFQIAEMHKQPAWFACADSRSSEYFPCRVVRTFLMSGWRDAVRLLLLIDLQICKNKCTFASARGMSSRFATKPQGPSFWALTSNPSNIVKK